MRTVWLIALSLAACQKEPAPPAPPAAPETPATPQAETPEKPEEVEQVDVVGEPVTFAPLTPGAVCTYELKEVLTEALGDQLLAGHELTIHYELRAKRTTSEGAITLDAEVTRIQADARRDKYTAKLDSERTADLRRVQGGADTIVMYEMVLPFALLGRTFTIELDDRGRLRSMKGGDAARQALFEMHPPQPRGVPHYRKKVEVALSDEAILDYLLPTALAVPEEGPFASGRQEMEEDVTFDLVEYAGVGNQAVRMSVRPERWLLERKAGFIPVEEVSSKVPPLERAVATVKLLNGDRSLTAEFEPKNPCFRRAGAAFNDLAVWTGMIEEVETTTQRKRSITRIWDKK